MDLDWRRFMQGWLIRLGLASPPIKQSLLHEFVNDQDFLVEARVLAWLSEPSWLSVPGSIDLILRVRRQHPSESVLAIRIISLIFKVQIQRRQDGRQKSFFAWSANSLRRQTTRHDRRFSATVAGTSSRYRRDFLA